MPVAKVLVLGRLADAQVHADLALQAIRSPTLAGKALQEVLGLAFCGLRSHVSQQHHVAV